MNDYLFLKSGDCFSKVYLSEILYAKADRKYVCIATAAKTYFIRCSFKFMVETALNHIQFCRIHKSYIVSLFHITRFDGKSVFIESKKLPIGRHYKEDLWKKLVSFDPGMNIDYSLFSTEV